MIEVTKEFQSHTAHRLLTHEGACGHLHGHTYRWEVTIVRGPGRSLDAAGMVVDFSDVSKTVGAFIKDTFDHAVVLQEGDPLVAAILDADPSTCLIVTDFPPTAEHLSRFVLEEASRRISGLLASLRCSRVVCWETPTSHAVCSER